MKADIYLANGTKISLEGSPEEILQVKSKLEGNHKPSLARKKSLRNNKSRIKKEGPIQRIRGLVEEGFFKQKKNINDIKNKFEERAIFYGLGSLSPALIRLVKKGIIRRIKEGGKWLYVNP